MQYQEVIKLKEELKKEFEKETGLTPQYRDDWIRWLEVNEPIKRKPDASEENLAIISNERHKRDKISRDIYYQALADAFGYEKLPSSVFD